MEDSLINSPNKSLRGKLTRLQAILTPKDISIPNTKIKKLESSYQADETAGMGDKMRVDTPAMIDDISYSDLTLDSDENELGESIFQARKNIQSKLRRRQLKNVSTSFTKPVYITKSHDLTIDNTYRGSEDELESSNDRLNLMQVKENIINQRKRLIETEEDSFTSKRTKKLNLSTSLTTILEDNQLPHGEPIKHFSYSSKNEDDSHSSNSGEGTCSFDLENKGKFRFHRQRKSISFKMEKIIPEFKDNSFHSAQIDSERTSDSSRSNIPVSYESSSFIQKSKKKKISSNTELTSVITLASGSENKNQKKVPGHSSLKSTVVNDSMPHQETDYSLDKSDEAVIENEGRSRFTRQRKSINFNNLDLIVDGFNEETVPTSPTDLHKSDSSLVGTRSSPRKSMSNKETTHSSSENKTRERIPDISPMKTAALHNSLPHSESNSSLDESDEAVFENDGRSRFMQQRKSITFNKLDFIVGGLNEEPVPTSPTDLHKSDRSLVGIRSSPRKSVSNKETTHSSSENKMHERISGISPTKTTALDNSLPYYKLNSSLDNSDEAIIENEGRSRFTQQRKSVNFNKLNLNVSGLNEETVPTSPTDLRKSDSSLVGTRSSPRRSMSNKETTHSSSKNKMHERIPDIPPMKTAALHNSLPHSESNSSLDKSDKAVFENDGRSRFMRQRKSIKLNKLDFIVGGLNEETVPTSPTDLRKSDSFLVGTRSSPRRSMSNKETTHSSSENKMHERIPDIPPMKTAALHNSLPHSESNSSLDKSDEAVFENDGRSRFTRQRKSIKFNKLDFIVGGLNEETVPTSPTDLHKRDSSLVGTRSSPRKSMSNKETTHYSSKNKMHERIPDISPMKTAALHNSLPHSESNSSLDKSDKAVFENDGRSRFMRQRKSIKLNKLDFIVGGLNEETVPTSPTDLRKSDSFLVGTRSSPRRSMSNKETTHSSSKNKMHERIPDIPPMKTAALHNSLPHSESNSSLDKSDEAVFENDGRSRFTRQRKSIKFNKLDFIVGGLNEETVPTLPTDLHKSDSSLVGTRSSPRKSMSNKETTHSSSKNKMHERIPDISPMKTAALHNSLPHSESNSSLDKSDEAVFENDGRSRFMRQRKSIKFNKLDFIVDGLNEKPVPTLPTDLHKSDSSLVGARSSPRKSMSNKETTHSSSENKMHERILGISPTKTTALDNSLPYSEPNSSLDKWDAVVDNEGRSRFTRQRKLVNFNKLDLNVGGLNEETVSTSPTDLRKSDSTLVGTRSSPRKSMSSKETTYSSSVNKMYQKIPYISPMKTTALHNSFLHSEPNSSLDKSDEAIKKKEGTSRFTRQQKSIIFNKLDSILGGLNEETVPTSPTDLHKSRISLVGTRSSPRKAMSNKETTHSGSENKTHERIPDISPMKTAALHNSLPHIENERKSQFTQKRKSIIFNKLDSIVGGLNDENVTMVATNHSVRESSIVDTRKSPSVAILINEAIAGKQTPSTSKPLIQKKILGQSSENLNPILLDSIISTQKYSGFEASRDSGSSIHSNNALVYSDVPQTIEIKSSSVSSEKMSNDTSKNMLNSASISQTQSLKRSIPRTREQQGSLQDEDNLSCSTISSDVPTLIFEANSPPTQEDSVESTSEMKLTTDDIPHLQQNIPNLMEMHDPNSPLILNTMQDHHVSLKSISQKPLQEKSIDMHGAIQSSSPKGNSLLKLSTSYSMHGSCQSFKHSNNNPHSSLLVPSFNSPREILSSSIRKSLFKTSLISKQKSGAKFGNQSSSKNSSLETINVFSTHKKNNDSHSVTNDAASREQCVETQQNRESSMKQLTLAQFLEKMSKGMLPARKEQKSLDCLFKRPAILDGVIPTKTFKTRAKKSQSQQPQSKSSTINMPYKMNKNIFEHFSQHKVTKEGVEAFHTIMQKFWQNLVSDIEVILTTAQRVTLNKDKIQFLLKQLKLFSSEEEMHSMLQELLPMDEWEKVIPKIYAFNRVFPP